MAQNHNIGLTLVSPESLSTATDDWLEIEQAPWPEEPTGGFAGWAATEGKEISEETLLEYSEIYAPQCAGDGILEVELWVYLSRPDLAYALTASYGELATQPIKATGEHTYSETIEQTDHLDLEREIVGTITAKWEGKVIGEDLSYIDPPTISQDGSVLSWGVVCTGTLRLSYAEEHDTWFLSIAPRPSGEYDPEDIETAYQSTVIAVFTGGDPVTHEVDLSIIGDDCPSYGVSWQTDDDDEEGDCYDLHIKYHQCTGEEISRELVSVPCPQTDEDEDEEDES